ncbi:DUF2799 domain-containing protein [Aeromonas simiae]|uniref:DUF2799 domain-containing protein n=1 Tax=Aeromonas simiae TaxID=218936 RepID=A0A5J6WSF7_9GAMM|nr:DUF2799 domain-containing protein [Aeromonas simiae]QFI53760.1 DUF2799 domain-containing protein [Aeromonas simiae]
MPSRLLILTLPLLLGACSTLSEEECRNASWYNLGYQDGERGRTQQEIPKYRESCNEYGVKVDETEWKRGYQKGLELFCIPELAYSKGRDGVEYLGVCPNDASFLKQYQRGRDEYLLNQRIAELQDELRRLDDEIGAVERKMRSSDGDELDYYRSQRYRMIRHAEAVQEEIWRLRNPPKVIEFKL